MWLHMFVHSLEVRGSLQIEFGLGELAGLRA